MSAMLQALWSYRGFIFGSVKREFQLKYRNSMLGAAWTIIQPLSMIIVYTVIFAQIISAKLPGVESTFGYSIYLCAGIITWGLFAEIVSRSQSVFLENANLLKKLNFPRLCLPVTIVATALINFGIIFGLFLIFLLISGNFPGWIVLAVLPLLVLQISFAVGMGMVIGVLNVFFRDVGHLFNVAIQFWFWLTPIVYPSNILPESVRKLMYFNPMAGLMNGYQTIFVHGSAPEWSLLLPVIVAAFAFCLLGLRLFRKRVGEMVDEL